MPGNMPGRLRHYLCDAHTRTEPQPLTDLPGVIGSVRAAYTRPIQPGAGYVAVRYCATGPYRRSYPDGC